MSEPASPAAGERPGEYQSFPIVPLVAGCAVVVVLVVGVIMAVALRGGTTRDDEGGLADDVEVFTTVVLSSRPPERAYDHLAEACREQVTFEAFEDAVDEAREELERRFDLDLGTLAVAEVRTRDVADDRGEAAVSLEEIGLEELPVGEVFEATGWSAWAYESGVWRATDCAAPGGLVSLDL
jgi:hypothetical protein